MTTDDASAPEGDATSGADDSVSAIGPASSSRAGSQTSSVYPRSGKGLEFDRFANFCDAVYAIAMTLIAATIAVPSVLEASTDAELTQHLKDSFPNIVMFFVAFAIIGRYWITNHQFVSELKAVSSGYIVLGLVYLSFVAFLPFPSALMGRFSSNPVAVSMFAVTMAAVSGMETVLIWRAYRDDLFGVLPPQDVQRWYLAGSASPVVFFLVSVPVMFVSTWLGMAVWVLMWPWGLVLNRFRPVSDYAYLSDRHRSDRAETSD